MYQNECIIDQPQSTPRRDEFYSRNEVETSGKKKAAIQNGKKKKKKKIFTTRKREPETLTPPLCFPIHYR
jgi:hypothetical protein